MQENKLREAGIDWATRTALSEACGLLERAAQLLSEDNARRSDRMTTRNAYNVKLHCAVRLLDLAAQAEVENATANAATPETGDC